MHVRYIIYRLALNKTPLSSGSNSSGGGAHGAALESDVAANVQLAWAKLYLARLVASYEQVWKCGSRRGGAVSACVVVRAERYWDSVGQRSTLVMALYNRASCGMHFCTQGHVVFLEEEKRGGRRAPRFKGHFLRLGTLD